MPRRVSLLLCYLGKAIDSINKLFTQILRTLPSRQFAVRELCSWRCSDVAVERAHARYQAVAHRSAAAHTSLCSSCNWNADGAYTGGYSEGRNLTFLLSQKFEIKNSRTPPADRLIHPLLMTILLRTTSRKIFFLKKFFVSF